MHVTIYHEAKLRFRASTRGHHIWADQPFSRGGQDSGMTPTECFLSALGSCMGLSAVRYLDTQGISPAGLQVSLNLEGESSVLKPLSHIRVHVVLDAPLDHDQRLGLKQAVESCILLRLIHDSLTISTEILSALPKS